MQEIINKMEMESKKFKITSTPTFIVNDKHKIFLEKELRIID